MSQNMHDDIERVLFSADDIAARVRELGAQITRDYEGKYPLVVCILRGGVVFATDLFRAMDLPAEIDFMAVSSYGSGTTSSGRVRKLKDLDSDCSGRHVIIVEDVLDSGRTLRYLREDFATRGAASVEIATLLHKNLDSVVNPRYVGFQCPDDFVVGYGLDYDQAYRNLPYVGVLKPEVYTK